jgi:23S rRNA pseudouridine1911/1915/1917 synthase
MSGQRLIDMAQIMSNPIEFEVEKPGIRLDKLVATHLPTLSRTQVQALIKAGDVTVNGEQLKPGIKLNGGEVVRVTLPEPETETSPQPEAIDLTVIFEDDDLAVINKPAGMVIHPGVGNETGTLVNALLGRYPQIMTMNDPEHRHGIVHRLDKETSGLIVIAKNDDALEDLMAQFQERLVDKTYLAMLERTPSTHNGRIDAPIGRDPKQRKKMAVLRDGKPAVTEFEVLDDKFRNDACLVRFRLLTGRTHQIRVHAAFINCPVIGDRIYGYRKQRFNKMKRHFLHAAHLSFEHPRTGDRLSFEADLPVGLEQIMLKLRE